MVLTLLALSACNPPLPEETGNWPDSGLDSGAIDSGDSGETGETGDSDTDTGPADADGDGSAADLDCDDGDASVFPGAVETLDGQDEDCDDVIDEVDAEPLVYGSGAGFGYNLISFPNESGTGQDVAVCAYASGDIQVFGGEDLARGGAAESLRRVLIDGPVTSLLGVDMLVEPVGGDDALADLAAGAPGLSAVVMVRNPDLFGDADLDASTDARVLSGTGGYFGKSLDLVDDLLVVGAPGLDARETGTAYVFDADTLAHPYTGAIDDAGRIEGTFGTGYDVAGIDWDGDGNEDLVVGNPLATDGARVFAGQVALWLDPPGPGDVVELRDADLSVTGTTANTYLGGALVPVPDLDGDGYNELLTGTAVVADGEERSVALVQSNGGAAADTLAVVSGIPVDKASSSALSVGDVTGDGVLDVAIGAFGQTDQVLIFDGTRLAGGAAFETADADAWIESVTPDDDDFGLGVLLLATGAGTAADVLVGAPSDGDGALYLTPSAF